MHKDTDEKSASFWKKQFSTDITTNQYAFDVLFGAIGPLLCIIFDPFVFKYNNFLTSPVVGYRVSAYLGIAIGISSLIIWLTFRSRMGRKLTDFLAGIFLFGALFASIGGLVILPYSLIGVLVYGLGLLGLLPFITGFVFLRNGVRAFRYGEQIFNGKISTWGFVILGLTMIISVLAFAQWQTSKTVSQGMQLVLNGNEIMVEKGVENLKNAFWCDQACYEEIVVAYTKESDEKRRVILAKAYQEITGHSIEEAVQEMFAD